MLQFVGDNARQFTTNYGNVSAASIGAIQRALLEIEQQGGEKFFGEPMLDVDDLLQTDRHGRGMVNILAADELIRSPKLYATFLLWMLSELFERLPEVGDPEKPTLVFFFDEAHLLFTDAPAALVEKIEQVVRLIRSKGVGVYFVTQSPSDIPDTVLGQLGNRVQHALRAFTPRDQKAVKTAADTLRPNPKLDVGSAITELAVGEALVSLLDAKGSPTVTERAWIVAARVANRSDYRRAARRHPASRRPRSTGTTRKRSIASRRTRSCRRRATGAGRGGRGRSGQDWPTEAREARSVGTGSDDYRCAVVDSAGNHRTARGTPRWSRPVGRQERRTLRRLRAWTGDLERRPGFDSRRDDVALAIASLTRHQASPEPPASAPDDLLASFAEPRLS